MEHNPTVMIVEDETLLLEAISKKLHVSGFGTVSCSSAKQAFDYLASLPRMPDVIWLDYYLKDTNGIDFMHTLKANPKWAAIPVVVVSNSASDLKVQSMLALGVNKYLLKAQHRLDDIIQELRNVMVINKTA